MNRDRVIPALTAGAAVISGVAALAWWLALEPVVQVEPSVPGRDDPQGRKKAAAEADAKPTRIGEFFVSSAGQPGDPTYAWPRFRGPQSDNISTQGVALADSWPDSGPRVLWTVPLGEGYAAPVVWGGRVFVLDYDEASQREWLRCLSLEDGAEIWRRGHAVPMKRNHGLSRTAPAVTERFTVTIGPKCHVMCVNTLSGDLLWGVDMVARYGTTVPGWYAGQCPLSDAGRVILAPAGTNVLLTALDGNDGRTLWETPNPGAWKMSHSSVMPAVIHGKRMYLYAAVGGAAGISAEGSDEGRLLWQTTEWAPSVVVPSPVVLPDGTVYLTAGYNAGSMALRVERDGDGFKAVPLGRHTPRERLASEQQTPVLWGSRLYAILPKDSGALSREFACADAEGRIVWSSGKADRFGIGPFLVADGKFFILDDDGTLTVARASADGYEPLARARVLKGTDAWGPMAIAGRRLLVRDSTSLACVEVGAPGQ
jgi:outer membrane protein assembly factor BamB